MSGGHFEYIQYRISEAADEVQNYIQRCNSEEIDEYGWKPEYSQETLDKFKQCDLALRQAYIMLNRVDWLVSGDDGEDNFHLRWNEELGIIPNAKEEGQ